MQTDLPLAFPGQQLDFFKVLFPPVAPAAARFKTRVAIIFGRLPTGLICELVATRFTQGSMGRNAYTLSRPNHGALMIFTNGALLVRKPTPPNVEQHFTLKRVETGRLVSFVRSNGLAALHRAAKHELQARVKASLISSARKRRAS